MSDLTFFLNVSNYYYPFYSVVFEKTIFFLIFSLLYESLLLLFINLFFYKFQFLFYL